MGLGQQLRFTMLALAASSLGAGRYLTDLLNKNNAFVHRPPASMIEQLDASYTESIPVSVHAQRPSQVLDALSRRWEGFLKGESNQLLVPNAAPRTCRVAESDVSVAVHMHAGKLKRLLTLVRRWGDGPVSAAMYVTSRRDIDQLAVFLRSYPSELCHTTFHILFEKAASSEEEPLKSLGYPFNALRDLALWNIDTEYFLTLDVDLVTVSKGHKQIRNILELNPTLRDSMKNKTLLVLPAFNYEHRLTDVEWLSQARNLLPDSKEAAIKQYRDGTLTGFKSKVHPRGHGPTDLERWSTERDVSYPVPFRAGFEPYVLGRLDPGVLPRYRTGFRGVGLDKISWITESVCAGYRLEVLRDAWLVHLDHDYGPTRQSRATKLEFRKFQRYIRQKYRYNLDRNQLVKLPERTRRAAGEEETLPQPNKRHRRLHAPPRPRGARFGGGTTSSSHDPNRKLYEPPTRRFSKRFGEFQKGVTPFRNNRQLRRRRRAVGSAWRDRRHTKG